MHFHHFFFLHYQIHHDINNNHPLFYLNKFLLQIYLFQKYQYKHQNLHCQILYYLMAQLAKYMFHFFLFYYFSKNHDSIQNGYFFLWLLETKDKYHFYLVNLFQSILNIFHRIYIYLYHNHYVQEDHLIYL